MTLIYERWRSGLLAKDLCQAETKKREDGVGRD